MKKPTQALENASADRVALERTGAVGTVGAVWAARTGAWTPRAVRTVRAGTGAWAERRTADMDADRRSGIRIVRIVPRRGRYDDGPADDDRRGRDDHGIRRDDVMGEPDGRGCQAHDAGGKSKTMMMVVVVVMSTGEYACCCRQSHRHN